MSSASLEQAEVLGEISSSFSKVKTRERRALPTFPTGLAVTVSLHPVA